MKKLQNNTENKTNYSKKHLHERFKKCFFGYVCAMTVKDLGGHDLLAYSGRLCHDDEGPWHDDEGPLP